MGSQVHMTKAETLGKEWGYYKRNIDKQKRELKQLEQKDDNRRFGGRDDYDRGGHGGNNY